MEFSNKLLVSLRQDIKILNSIISEILQDLTHSELNSWLYPTKTYKDSQELNTIENSFKDKQYINYLEFIIDRLYLFINLVEDYIGKFPNVPKQDNRKNILRPNNLSLGAATSLFWKGVKNLNETLTLNYKLLQKEASSTAENMMQIVNKNTQTNVYASTVCDSCDIAVSCIKEIVNELESDSHANFVRTIRKNLQDDIYNITQCGCMSRLTTAITKDLNHFTKLLKDAENKSKEDDLKIKDLNTKYCNSLNVIKKNELSFKRMRKHSANVKLKNKSLIRNINSLLEVNRENQVKLIQGRRKIEILEKSIQENVTTVALLSTDNEKLHENIGEFLKEKIEIESEASLWKRRFSEMYLENRNLKSEIEEMQTVADLLRDIALSCDKLSDKLERYNVEVLQRARNFENNFKNVTDTINALNKIQDKTLKTKDINHFQITGNPIADMQKQIESNNLDIVRLEKNNVDLLKTIHRLQEQKLNKKF